MIGYLIAAEPESVRTITGAFTSVGAQTIQPYACILPWSGTAEQLGGHLRLILPEAKLVICEISGGWRLQ